jgi:hypothetical protein
MATDTSAMNLVGLAQAKAKRNESTERQATILGLESVNHASMDVKLASGQTMENAQAAILITSGTKQVTASSETIHVRFVPLMTTQLAEIEF